MKYTVLAGRILFALIFIAGAAGHFSPETIAFSASKGLPMAGILVPLSGILMLVAGLSVALGYKAKTGALLLVLFMLPTTFIFHNFWTITDPMMKQMDMAMFMKNISITGAALIMAYFGAGPVSIDERNNEKVRTATTIR